MISYRRALTHAWGRQRGMCSTGSQLVFSSVDCVARNAMLMFPDRMMVFDQAPIMLPAAECAAHRYLASSEHDEIARLSVELGFQVAARCRARELYAGLYAHRDTPPLAPASFSLCNGRVRGPQHAILFFKLDLLK